MQRFQILGFVGVVAGVVLLGAPTTQAAPAMGAVHIVQAVPGASVTVVIDGKQVSSDVAVGTVLRPFELASGKHDVTREPRDLDRFHRLWHVMAQVNLG